MQLEKNNNSGAVIRVPAVTVRAAGPNEGFSFRFLGASPRDPLLEEKEPHGHGGVVGGSGLPRAGLWERESAARMLALMGGMRFASREPGHVGERGARTTLGK